MNAGRSVRRVTIWSLVVNLVLSGVKLVLGLLGGSQALVADAVHSLSDAVTDVTVLVGERFWSAPPDDAHPYGHGRIETVIAFFIGIVLAGVGIGLGYRAIATLHEAHARSPGWLAFAGACASIVVKEWLYRWNVAVGRRIRSVVLLANAWHHRSDALSSVPVAIAVLATRIWPGWWFLDHIATVIVAVLILAAAWQICWPAFSRLIDVGAAGHERQKILSLAESTEGVRSVHGLRTRYMGTGLFVDLHVLVDPELSVRRGHDIARAVKARLLTSGPDIVDVLVHIEPSDN
ncbi:MAG: cation transporter [Planctomycetes bacterium]|nr:cation transporter [Planctomycetota bacterium]